MEIKRRIKGIFMDAIKGNTWRDWIQTALTIIALIGVSVKITRSFDAVAERVSMVEAKVAQIEKHGTDLASKDHDLIIQMNTNLSALMAQFSAMCNKMEKHIDMDKP